MLFTFVLPADLTLFARHLVRLTRKRKAISSVPTRGKISARRNQSPLPLAAAAVAAVEALVEAVDVVADADAAVALPQATAPPDPGSGFPLCLEIKGELLGTLVTYVEKECV